jgi:hypothetical protein
MTELTAGKQRPFNRAETEAEVEAAVDSLAGNLATLIGQVHPRAVIHNTAADARKFATSGFQQLKSQLVNEDGPRRARLALVAGAAIGGIAFVAIVGSLVRKR